MRHYVSVLPLALGMVACTGPTPCESDTPLFKYVPIDAEVMQTEFENSRRVRRPDPVGLNHLNAWWKERLISILTTTHMNSNAESSSCSVLRSQNSTESFEINFCCKSDNVSPTSHLALRRPGTNATRLNREVVEFPSVTIITMNNGQRYTDTNALLNVLYVLPSMKSRFMSHLLSHWNQRHKDKECVARVVYMSYQCVVVRIAHGIKSNAKYLIERT